jgi:hypothetical protein
VNLLTPVERSRFCVLLLEVVQCPDQGLAELCARVSAVAAPPLVQRWGARLAQIKEDGVAGTMDVFQAGFRILKLAFRIWPDA